MLKHLHYTFHNCEAKRKSEGGIYSLPRRIVCEYKMQIQLMQISINQPAPCCLNSKLPNSSEENPRMNTIVCYI